MNRISSPRTLLLPLLMVCFAGFAQDNDAQVRNADNGLPSIDTQKLVRVIYPPLTERDGKGMVLPIPPNEHPRLYFRKADIPMLKKKLSHPLMTACWETIKKNANAGFDGKLNQDLPNNIDIKVLGAIESKAFLYAFDQKNALGKEAVVAIQNLNNSLVFNNQMPDYCRVIGRVIHTTALVYDWCYELISPKEKNNLILQMESLATKMEVEWPKLVQGSVVGHGVEAQLSRDMLACGIATYYEKPQIYKLVAGRILAEFVPVRNYFYPASYHHQGSSYGAYRFRADLYFTLLFDKMGYPNVVSKTQGTVPYKWLYTRRPDGQLLRDGDDYSEQFTAFGKYWDVPGDAITATYYKDAVLMAEAIKEKQIGKDPLIDFLLIDPTIFTNSKSVVLPLSKYFPAPLGAMVARTGWQNDITANTVVAEMKIGVHSFANHQHLDGGNFQIYYKGPLAVNSGIYQGTMGSYGSDHFLNYYQRTIAHNSMLIYDPNEQFKWYDKTIQNDGGQQYPNGSDEPKNLQALLSKNYETGEVLAHDIGPDAIKPEYTYIKGELAKAYGNKVKSFKRSFVFLNFFDDKVPAALIVFDRVEAADKNFKKTWLLHCVEEPNIAANVTTLNRNEKGYNGKLVNTTLLPFTDNLSIQKIGGSDNAFSVNRINYPQKMKVEDNSSDGAIWRLEVSPKGNAEIDNFLNVLQVMDYKGRNTKPLLVEKIETTHFVGTALGNRLVLFNKTSEVSNDSIHLQITTNNITKVLITDVAKGIWKVHSLDAQKNSFQELKNENGILYFDAKQGSYVIEKKLF